MIRSLHICFTLFGDFRYDSRSYKCIKSLQQHGHRISVVMTGRNSESFGTGGIVVTEVGVRKWFWSKLSFIQFYAKSLLPAIRLKAQVYFASDLYSLPIAYLAARLNRSKLIYDSRELYSSIAALKDRQAAQWVWRVVERVLIRRVNAVVTVNDSIAWILSRQYGIPKPVVLLNCPQYQELERSNRLRELCHISEEKHILLYQGGFQRGRGIFVSLELIQHLPNCVLVLLGDGPLKEYLHIRIEELKDRVYMVEAVPVDQLLRYTASADVGLCLIENHGISYYHSLPNKFFEYVMAGVPVVASRFPEMKKIVDNHRVGETTDPDDVTEIVEKIQKLLHAGYHDEIVHNCRRTAKIYNWDHESEKLIEVIENLATP